jgi:segregation and condensation protein B
MSADALHGMSADALHGTSADALHGTSADSLADAGAEGAGADPDAGPTAGYGTAGPGATEPAEDLTTQQIEALLFVAERPLSRREIATLAGVDAATVDARLGDLEVDLAHRGIRLLSAGDRVALATAPDAGGLIARYVGTEGVRLTPAALETLAIVAYRQPVTRSVIERIRGVDSDYVVRSLLHRRLIAEQGRSDAPGRPILYGTSFEFLERFGLTSLDELPEIEAGIAARLAEADAEPDQAAVGGSRAGMAEHESDGQASAFERNGV